MAQTPSYALQLEWPNLSGSTTAAKLAQLNAMTVAGPNIDLSINQIIGYLLLQGIYPTIVTFASGSPTNAQPHDGALTALKTFLAWGSLQNPPPVETSKADVFAQISAMGQAVVAQEAASPGSTGFTQAVYNALVALAQTTQPWWQANGFSGPISLSDAADAGLS